MGSAVMGPMAGVGCTLWDQLNHLPPDCPPTLAQLCLAEIRSLTLGRLPTSVTLTQTVWFLQM